jgi:hypothetical protein
VRVLIAVGVLALPLLAVGFKGRAKGMDHWLLDYAAWSRSRPAAQSLPRPVHVMFLTADHFEPGADAELVRAWCGRYVRLAASHRDSDGRPPRHTWFYPAEQFDSRQAAALSHMCERGYGEIELHLHHSYDTHDSLRRKLERARRQFAGVGAMVTAGSDPQHAFAFVHGNMSLDNSRGDAYCGVDDELTLLRQEGCFADFTFPSLERRSQPAMVNRPYYAQDDPRQAGSYLGGGRGMRVGGRGRGLLIFQGPLVIDFSNWSHLLYPTLDVADRGDTNRPTPHRVDLWVGAGVHVRGRPEWVFVKTFTHGAVRGAWPHVTGADADRMFAHLESRYNDGRSYVLHYVTAREAYNIAKAAEAGKTGNPDAYRDYLIKPYRDASLRRPAGMAARGDVRIAGCGRTPRKQGAAGA